MRSSGHWVMSSSGVAVAWAIGAVPSVAYAQVEVPPAPPAEQVGTAPPARPDINPYDRDIGMTVPLQFNNRVLGELDVLLTRDDRFLVRSESFILQISPLLTEAARAELTAALAGREMFEAEEIVGSGISLNYDPDQLAVLVLRIDPSRRAVERLFEDVDPEGRGLAPEPFSAYLNANIGVVKDHSRSDISDPSIGLMGAIRYKRLVLEADYTGDRGFDDGGYGFDRQHVRLVYDEPEDFRRWWIGDLDPEYRGRQGYVDMGGIGVARQRRTFDTFRRSILAGDRKIVLQEDSLVRVTRNGMLVREFQLDAGQYDLSNLPLEYGSNDLQIEIQNPTGRIQTVNYSAYLDSIDLEPGDYEYGAFLGKTNTAFFGSPEYSDGNWVFSGYWQKAFDNRPAIGLGMQLSEDVQNLTAQSQIILTNGSRLRGDLAFSEGLSGAGFAGMLSYEHLVDLGETMDSWAVAVDYTSEDYASLGNPTGGNSNAWSFSGTYTHQFSLDWGVTFSGAYQVSRADNSRDGYSLAGYTSYRVRNDVSVQFGAVYSDLGYADRDGDWNLTVGLVWQPRGDRRVEGRYSSRDNAGSVRFSQVADNRVGGWGYSVGAGYADGPADVSGSVNYLGNRFDAGVSHTTYGSSFGDVTDRQVTSMRVGSAIAFTGGQLAVSRQIYDSFAMVRAHDTLNGRQTIIGDSFERGHYTGRSGALGPAVANALASYVNQTVYYDVIDVPAGYDVGEGLKRVHPAYRSGYLITAGSDAFVSVVGRLSGRSGGPAALMSGRLSDVGDAEMKPEIFFTNSVGRFAAQKLKPGHTYRVELFSSPPEVFEFTVPEDNEGLLDLGVVTLKVVDPDANEENAR